MQSFKWLEVSAIRDLMNGMQPCIMRSKIVSMAVVALEPWVSGKLNELLGSKDDTTRPQGLSLYRDVRYK